MMNPNLLAGLSMLLGTIGTAISAVSHLIEVVKSHGADVAQLESAATDARAAHGRLTDAIGAIKAGA